MAACPLYPHTCCFHRATTSECAFHQLRHADNLPFPNQIIWFANTCDGWSDDRRSLRSQEAGVRHGALGRFRYLRAQPWSPFRWFRCTFRRLALDNMGAPVALCCHFCPVLFLYSETSASNILCQPPPQGNRKPLDQVSFRDRNGSHVTPGSCSQRPHTPNHP